VTTFALIHGGWHGSWCWELVVPELEALGYRVVTPDLPISDPAVGSMGWAEIVAAEIGNDADVVAVGHSMGGMALPALASIRPLRRMVFLGGLVPPPGRVFGEYLAGESDASTMDVSANVDGDWVRVPSYEMMREFLYHDCGEQASRRAYERLRPQALTTFTEVYPIASWPDTPSSSIVMTGDRCIGNTWSRRVAEELLGTSVIELPGSHSPMYSRPRHLAEVLSKL
jgi:pimeloyl-ACP methyl ester carboxylesterase